MGKLSCSLAYGVPVQVCISVCYKPRMVIDFPAAFLAFGEIAGQEHGKYRYTLTDEQERR